MLDFALSARAFSVVHAAERLSAARLTCRRAEATVLDTQGAVAAVAQRDRAYLAVRAAADELIEAQRRLRLACRDCLIHSELQPRAARGCRRHAALLTLA